MSHSFIIKPTSTLTTSLTFLFLSFSASSELVHLPALLLAPNSSRHAIPVAFSRIPSDDSWVVTANVFSSLLFSRNDVLVAIRRLVVDSVELLNSSPSSPSSSIRDSSVDVFVTIRRQMFCAFELLDSSLSSTSILDPSAIEFCCVGVSATARLPSICELLLLAATVAAFIARLFLGSESSGLGMSFNSCVTSSPLLTFHSTSFQQLASPIWSCLETFLAPDVAGVRRSLCSLSRSIALQPGHPAVVPKASMSVLVILSLCTRAPSNGTGGGLPTVHLP